MPELPEVEALAAFLSEHALGRRVVRVDVVSLAALKTFDPPVTALTGGEVVAVSRHGKFLDLTVTGEAGAAGHPRTAGDQQVTHHLVIHLARAGWLRWRERLPAAPPRPGAGPLALRVHLAAGEPALPGERPEACGFDVTEAGTRKKVAVYVVRDARDVPGVAALGPDALDERMSAELLTVLAGGSHVRLKGWLTDQTVLAGIGNAYSDEILHVARLSPFRMVDTLQPDEMQRLADAVRDVLTDAVARSVGQDAALLKSEKRTGLRVHGRTGLPCPVCGDVVREVAYADKSFQYCATCQTGGRVLADRRLSRLVK